MQFTPMESGGFDAATTDDQNFMMLSAGLLSPKSKGNMTISSASMLDSPVISPNWLQDDADVEMAYQLILRAREILRSWKGNLGEVLPGSSVSSKDDIIQWLRNNMFHMSHGTSSCELVPKRISPVASEDVVADDFRFQARWVPTLKPPVPTPEAGSMVSLAFE
jgi:choline dehydrogenase